MPDVIHELYEKHVYPPMSHPLSDPAVSAVAARIAGLAVADPRRARILEIGCCSGHNLLPLARRWPESRFVGIDLAEWAIDEARERAALAGITNIDFIAGDLRDFEPADGPFDFIIAHGFFSWVPDEVKAALLLFCHRHLGPSGIATISFNLECGWKPRLPVIAKVRAIQQARGGDAMEALEILNTLTESADPEAAIIADMLAKGPAILAFDDFGPVNDPWPLDRFARAAANAGLRWLGESDPGGNIPSALGDPEIGELQSRATDPLAFQLAMDEAAGRTFRSGVLCRDDAPVAERISSSVVLDFSVRAGIEPADPAAQAVFQAIRSFAPACVPVREVIGDLDPRTAARQIFDGITRGCIRPRIEPVIFESDSQGFPRLDPLRLLCARRGLPIVDVWHVPCDFPARHFEVLALMDGSRTVRELAGFASRHCPELAFTPWLSHLAGRGFFS